MNECVKTGLVFVSVGSTGARVGDLFYNPSDGFFVNGIPPALKDHGVPVAREYHVEISRPRITLRDDGRYLIAYGFEILRMSADFADHVKQWYPDLAHKLASVPVIDFSKPLAEPPKVEVD